MKKSTDPLDVITDLGIKLEYGCGMFNGRPVRYLENLGIFQVGDDNFDRWANSLDFEFDLWLPKGMRKFQRWAKNK